MASPAMQDQEVDTVEHPTLGTLKFPKSMDYGQRNQIIEGMENPKVAGGTAPALRAHPPVEMKAPALGIQGDFDEQTQTNPNEPLLKTGLKSAVGGAGYPFVHPLKFAEGVGNLINPNMKENTLNQMIQGPGEDYREGGLPYAATKAAGNLVGGAGAGAGMGAMLGIGGEAADMVPRAGRAAAKFENLKTQLADTPVPLKASQPHLEHLAQVDATGPSMPSTVNKLLIRSQAIAPPNYPEARLFQENLSNPSILEKQSIGGSMKGGIKQLKGGLFEDIKSAADTKGLGEDYASAMNEFRRAQQLKSGLKAAGKIGVGAAGLGAVDRGVRRLIQ